MLPQLTRDRVIYGFVSSFVSFISILAHFVFSPPSRGLFPDKLRFYKCFPAFSRQRELVPSAETSRRREIIIMATFNDSLRSVAGMILPWATFNFVTDNFMCCAVWLPMRLTILNSPPPLGAHPAESHQRNLFAILMLEDVLRPLRVGCQ